MTTFADPLVPWVFKGLTALISEHPPKAIRVISPILALGPLLKSPTRRDP